MPSAQRAPAAQRFAVPFRSVRFGVQAPPSPWHRLRRGGPCDRRRRKPRPAVHHHGRQLVHRPHADRAEPPVRRGQPQVPAPCRPGALPPNNTKKTRSSQSEPALGRCEFFSCECSPYWALGTATADTPACMAGDGRTAARRDRQAGGRGKAAATIFHAEGARAAGSLRFSAPVRSPLCSG